MHVLQAEGDRIAHGPVESLSSRNNAFYVNRGCAHAPHTSNRSTHRTIKS